MPHIQKETGRASAGFHIIQRHHRTVQLRISAVQKENLYSLFQKAAVQRNIRIRKRALRRLDNQPPELLIHQVLQDFPLLLEPVIRKRNLNLKSFAGKNAFNPLNDSGKYIIVYIGCHHGNLAAFRIFFRFLVRHKGSASLASIHESFVLQNLQSPSHRLAAHAELFSQGLLRRKLLS